MKKIMLTLAFATLFTTLIACGDTATSVNEDVKENEEESSEANSEEKDNKTSAQEKEKNRQKTAEKLEKFITKLEQYEAELKESYNSYKDNNAEWTAFASEWDSKLQKLRDEIKNSDLKKSQSVAIGGAVDFLAKVKGEYTGGDSDEKALDSMKKSYKKNLQSAKDTLSDLKK